MLSVFSVYFCNKITPFETSNIKPLASHSNFVSFYFLDFDLVSHCFPCVFKKISNSRNYFSPVSLWSLSFIIFTSRGLKTDSFGKSLLLPDRVQHLCGKTLPLVRVKHPDPVDTTAGRLWLGTTAARSLTLGRTGTDRFIHILF